jgi:hypothetical protein
MKRRRLPLSTLLIGAAALVFVSCSEPTPLAPASRSATVEKSLLSPVTGLLQRTGLISCTPLAPAWDTQSIGPWGGTLHVGPHTFVVPAGALDHYVTISAYAPSDKYNDIQFEPEGLQFRKSASLTMSYSNCNLLGSLLPKHIAYVDGQLNILYLLQSVDNLLSQKVTGSVDHFSEYAIAW